MKPFLLFAAFLWGVFFYAEASTDSVFVDVNLLKFSSDFEKGQFSKFGKENSFDPVYFLFCLDSNTNSEKAENLKLRLYDFFDTKLSSAVSNKSIDKTIKAVFREIHDNLLTKYTLESRFEKLLDNGEYNCVTASALYALAFEKFNIPYQLRSTTSHVYVIANPGPNQMMIETTDPVYGAFQYNEQYQKTYIEMLVKQKMISKIEYGTFSINELFQKYFFSSDTISLKELIGYHYYNNGVEWVNKENYPEAVNQLSKAYVLNKSKQVEHLLSLALSNDVNQNFDIKDPLSVSKYFTLMKLIGENDYDYLYNQYLVATEELIIRKDDLPKFDTVSKLLLENISDTSTRNKFLEHYYSGKAYGYYMKRNFSSAYSNIFLANCINGKNLRIKAMFEEMESKMIYYISEDENPEAIDSITEELKTLGVNCSSEKVNRLILHLTLLKAGFMFEDDQIAVGNSLLQKAEDMAAQYSLTDIEDQYVNIAYSAAFRHYYLAYDFAKAKEYTLRGLKLDPGNELLERNLGGLDKTSDIKRTYPQTAPPPPPMPKSNNTTPRTVIIKTPH